MSDIPIILLAAGQSSRMRGVDKLLQEVDGMSLLRRQALMARAATQGDVLVALPPAPNPRFEEISDLDCRIVEVQSAEEGMNASLRQAFAALGTHEKAVMLLLADLPDLTADDLNKVMQAVDLESSSLIWRGTTETGKGGHPIVFAAALFGEFAELRGDDGGRAVVAKAKGRIHLVPLEGHRARGDLDTPEEWAAWRASRRNQTSE